LTDDERDAYAEHFYGGEPVDQPPACDWCEIIPVRHDDEYAPYCSEDCAREAADEESYDRVHPRPEEV
jgi:hypothetical protein